MNCGENKHAPEWLERCHDAIELMRSTVKEGLRASQLLIDDAHAGGLEHELCGAEMVAAFADYYQGNLDQAEAEFGRLALQCEVLGDQRVLTMCLYGMLRILRRRGLAHEAYQLGHQRVLSVLPAEPTWETVLVLNLMGVVAQGCGNADEAMRHFYRALEAARTLDLPKRVAQITANISEIFYVSGNAEDAEHMLIEARELAIAANEPSLASYVSSMLALCKLSLEKYDEAYLAVADYAAHVENDDTPDLANRAFCLSVAAYTLAMRDQLDEAEVLSGLAGDLLERFDDNQLKPYVWWVHGHLHHRRGRILPAITALSRVLDTVGESGYIYMRLRVLKELTEIYAEQGEWQKAYLEQQRYQTLFAQSQDQATRGRLQTLHVRSELKNAEMARQHVEQAMAERKHLEDSLKQSLAERDTVLEHSIVGIAMLSSGGRLQWANRAMVDMFGMQGTSYIGKSIEPYYPSREEYLRTGADAFEVIRKGQFYESELLMQHEDGTPFWAYLSGRAIAPDDLSQGTVWAVMDITKRRQLEEDLNKSEEHYRQVVNNVTEGILVIQDGHIVFANPRVLQLTGYTQEEVIGLPMLADVHPDDQSLVIDQFTRRERGEQVAQHYPVRIINRRLNAILWMEVSSVIIDWEGRKATLSFMTDITERRRLEDSLKNSMAESARLQTLQFQSELNEAESARRHAEETTKAKSMFLANMSHEIRTPMNAIIGMAHLALKSQLNPKQHDYVEKIHGAGISLLGIINDILDFSKIEAGKLAIEAVDFNLDNVVSHVSTITAAKAHEKGLEYLYQMPFDIPRNLVGDPLRLGQILINLVNNAVKFTERGEIYVGCQQLEADGDRVQLRFSVRDTGIGMSPEQAGKLFEAFSQADGSTTRKYGGTGLGLSISKGIVELMDGTIWLESEANVGTTIHFNAWFGLSTEPQRSVVLPPQLRGTRILVVDDNFAARTMLAEALSALSIEVDQAADADAALSAIRACDAGRPYGVVFTDLEMPGIDGIEFISTVRKDATLAAPPLLVLLSADGRDEIRHRAENTLADGFLSKPVNPSILINTLAALYGPAAATIPIRQREVLPHFQQLSVLLAEDNDVNQQIAMELMKAVGISVDVASNGRMAVEKLLKAGPKHYGLVFMDVQMPEMDGHEATQQIRADQRFSALPIIAMTAHAMVEERDRCIASGMNDHLAKPINPNQLYRTISRWCPTHVSSTPPPLANWSEAMTTENETLVIEGFDVQDGLSRTLGDRDFYQQLLVRFRDDQRDAPEKIRQALHDGDRQLAERLAHTLKGVSGMVSATKLTDLAVTLEAAIRAEAPVPDLLAHLTPIELEMSALVSTLARIIPPPADQIEVLPMRNIDVEAANMMIERLTHLLAQYDGEAIDFLSASASLLVAVMGSEVYRRIENATKKFDFDSALAILTKGAHDTEGAVQMNDHDKEATK